MYWQIAMNVGIQIYGNGDFYCMCSDHLFSENLLNKNLLHFAGVFLLRKDFHAERRTNQVVNVCKLIAMKMNCHQNQELTK